MIKMKKTSMIKLEPLKKLLNLINQRDFSETQNLNNNKVNPTKFKVENLNKEETKTIKVAIRTGKTTNHKVKETKVESPISITTNPTKTEENLLTTIKVETRTSITIKTSIRIKTSKKETDFLMISFILFNVQPLFY